MKTIAVYPGSFDPITFGHIEIIKRGLEIFDTVYVAVAANIRKKPLLTAQERVHLVQQSTLGFNKRLRVEAFDGLVVDYALKKKAKVIIRGLRATSDFDYEFQMALTNRNLTDKIQTLFLMPSQKHFYLSSSLIKELVWLGGKVSDFVPAVVEKKISRKIAAE